MSGDKPSSMSNLDAFKTHLSRLVAQAEADEEIIITRSGRPLAKIEPRTKLPLTFLDTNILVYAEDQSEPIKRKQAVQLILEHKRQRTGVVSLQVLQEFFTTVTKKYKLEPGIARYKVEFHSRFIVAEPTVNDILAAIDIHRFHGFSYWDALILRMAKQTGCRVLLTEDLQHGQVFEGVRIVNPFL